jgi:hypothetical protein
MLPSTLVNRSQLLAAATAITAVGFLTLAPPAQAKPTLPLAPGCSQWALPTVFILKQTNGDTVRMDTVTKKAQATGGSNGALQGPVEYFIQGDKLHFSIYWQDSYSGTYEGTVGDDGFAHGETHQITDRNVFAFWDSTVRLVCATPAAPPAGPAAPPAPASQPAPAPAAAARLGVVVRGPTTMPAGQSGTYTVSLSNSGELSVPVELFVSFGGQLQQSGQVTPPGGFNCDVINNAGGTSAVHCTTPQLQSKATESIVVQGRGSAPGAGHLTVNINSSDPGAQFVQKSQGLNVTIT